MGRSRVRGGEPWPETPATSPVTGDGGVPRLTVIPDDPNDVVGVEAYYGLENPCPITRNWRSVALVTVNGRLLGPLPVIDVHQYVFAFANVHYRNGLCLSSRLEAAVPADLGDARATDAPSLDIYDGSDGAGAWVTQSPSTDPIPPVRIPARAALAPDGTRGFDPLPALLAALVPGRRP